MDLYYKTPRTSETGKKFAEINKKGIECCDALKAFLDKYGFQKYRPSRISFQGGISSCVSPNGDLDKKVWKRMHYGSCEYMPNLKSKEGLKIAKEIESLPYVDIDELNNIVNYPGNGFKNTSIGYSFNDNKDYYGFIISDIWDVTPPADCIEIIGTEYNKLFNQSQK